MRIKILTICLFLFNTQICAGSNITKCRGENHRNWSDCVGSVALDGTAYVGHFKDGLYHGKGTFTFSDGATYVGEFNKGKESGYGIFTCWLHGAKYKGGFINGKKHGYGVYSYPNGDIYKGNWHNGMKHGEGEYIYKNKRVEKGLFSKDKFLKLNK